MYACEYCGREFRSPSAADACARFCGDEEKR